MAVRDWSTPVGSLPVRGMICRIVSTDDYVALHPEEVETWTTLCVMQLSPVRPPSASAGHRDVIGSGGDRVLRPLVRRAGPLGVGTPSRRDRLSLPAPARVGGLRSYLDELALGRR